MRLPTKLTTLSAGLVLGGLLATGAGLASADQPAAKVTICHRTGSVTNPYVRITVDRASVDGNPTNDGGQGDHYLEHRGPIGPIVDGEWGDIIPPMSGVHAGLNWDAAGRAAYANVCVPVVVATATPSIVGPSTTTTSVAPPPEST